MTDCLFCKFVAGTLSCYKIWEDERHLAFLTPFPNTPGFSVVITKEHLPSYGFAVDPAALTGLTLAARAVALQIDKNLGTKRTGLLMEGFGINHLHMKLFPMHGIESEQWRPLNSQTKTFYPQYAGLIASNDGPPMAEAELKAIQAKILGKVGA